MSDLSQARRGEGLRVLGWPAFRFPNPYNSLLYDAVRARGVRVDEFSPRRLLSGRYDVWHVHWPERFFNDPSYLSALGRSTALLLLMKAARLVGTRIVWTVHNLRSHERRFPELEERFWSSFAAMVDASISLSDTARDAAMVQFAPLTDKPSIVVSHGHFRGWYPDTLSKFEARKQLGLRGDGPVLSFVGQVRPYKNLPTLVTAFRELPQTDATLLIAGWPERSEHGEAVRSAAGNDRRVKLRLEWIPRPELQLYLRAADLIVLPYVDVLNSGATLLALSFDRPVLAPRKGSLISLEKSVGAEWLWTYSDPLTPLELTKAIQWAMSQPRSRPNLEAFEWTAIADRTIGVYQTVCG
jgi:beta-1,4-mannosyltransferase